MNNTVGLLMKTVYTKQYKKFGVVYPPQATDYTYNLENGILTIQRHGVNASDPISFRVGDYAEYNSYNLSYIGPIISITEKTVTIACQYDKTDIHRISLHEFCWRNYRFKLDETIKQNNEELYYI